MAELLKNEYFMGVVMSVIVFAFTQLLKMPIKALTSKIENERTRKIVNGTILLIPFILGVLFEFLLTTLVFHEPFTVIQGLTYGTGGISLYGVVERFFKVKNPYDTEEGEAVMELVEKVTEDGKVDENDKTALKEYLDLVSK
jgi:uncharacterized protein YacL